MGVIGYLQAFDHDTDSLFFGKHFSDTIAYFLYGIHESSVVLWFHIPDKAHLFFRHDEYVAGLDWVDIEKRECFVVLVDLVARYLALDDFRKY